MANESVPPTLYQVLQVHPAAPLDLISAAYWRLASQAQVRRGADPGAETQLYHLTVAYQVLADAASRASYDDSIGLAPEHLAPWLSRRRRGFFARLLPRDRLELDIHVDYYEVLRVDPDADTSVIHEAYSILRNHYLRLARRSNDGADLLDALEEAYAITSDPARRAEYDAARGHRRYVPSPPLVPAPVVRPSAPSPGGGSATAVAAPPVSAQPSAPAGFVAPPPREEARPAPPLAAPPRPSAVSPSPAAPPRARGTSAPAPAAAPEGASWLVHLGAGVRRLAVLAWRAVLFVAAVIAWAVAWAAGRVAAGVRRLRYDISESLGAREREAAAEEALLSRIVLQGEEPAVVAHLTLVEGPGSGASFDVDHFPLVLGCEPESDICLPELGAHEVRLLYRDGHFVVYSLARGATANPGAPVDGTGGEGEGFLWSVFESGEDIQIGPYRLRVTASRP